MATAIQITSCLTQARDKVIWYLNNNVFSSGLYGPTLPAGWSVVGAPDFNGDGHPDYLAFNSSTRTDGDMVS